jgi:calcium-dependent protein kinase
MKMYEYLEDDDFIYILAELCPGRELFDVIVENKFLPEAVARKIFYDIIGAVRYMHENHFMHRYTSEHLEI